MFAQELNILTNAIGSAMLRISQGAEMLSREHASEQKQIETMYELPARLKLVASMRSGSLSLEWHRIVESMSCPVRRSRGAAVGSYNSNFLGRVTAAPFIELAIRTERVAAKYREMWCKVESLGAELRSSWVLAATREWRAVYHCRGRHCWTQIPSSLRNNSSAAREQDQLSFELVTIDGELRSMQAALINEVAGLSVFWEQEKTRLRDQHRMSRYPDPCPVYLEIDSAPHFKPRWEVEPREGPRKCSLRRPLFDEMHNLSPGLHFQRFEKFVPQQFRESWEQVNVRAQAHLATALALDKLGDQLASIWEQVIPAMFPPIHHAGPSHAPHVSDTSTLRLLANSDRLAVVE